MSPSDWRMAHANSARTSSFKTLTGRIYVPNWSISLPKISFDDSSQFHRLPALITTGGMVIVPNFQENAFDSYSVANGERLWRAHLDGVLQYASTPVYYALSFYLILEERLLRISLLNGDVEVVLQSPYILPAEKCAPLVIVQYSPKNQPYRETAKLIWGLNGRILCYSVENGEPKQPEFLGHSAGDSLRTPVAINPNHILFTSGKGIIYELTLKENRINDTEVGDYSLSVPCVLDELVYFHGVTNSADRLLFNFNPKNGEIKRAKLSDDSLSDVTEFETSLWYPPVALGDYAILSDFYHSTFIRWIGTRSQSARLETHRFIDHQSVAVGQRIFSLSESGLYRLDLPSGTNSVMSLTRKPEDKPVPIGLPAVYANKLLVWCEDRLVCQSIS